MERERGVGSGKVLEPGFELKTPVAHSAVCWRVAHIAIGEDKNLKVLIKCYLTTDQQTGCASCVISPELKFDSVRLLPMNEQA